jgi:hypothetical protein
VPTGSTNMISLRGQKNATENRNSQAVNTVAAPTTHQRSRGSRHVKAVATRLLTTTVAPSGGK